MVLAVRVAVGVGEIEKVGEMLKVGDWLCVGEMVGEKVKVPRAVGE